jgi:hypothetical protein
MIREPPFAVSRIGTRHGPRTGESFNLYGGGSSVSSCSDGWKGRGIVVGSLLFPIHRGNTETTASLSETTEIVNRRTCFRGNKPTLTSAGSASPYQYQDQYQRKDYKTPDGAADYGSGIGCFRHHRSPRGAGLRRAARGGRTARGGCHRRTFQVIFDEEVVSIQLMAVKDSNIDGVGASG